MSGNSSSGWNPPSANQPTAKKGGAKPNFGKGILAGLVVCVLALGVLYVMCDSGRHLQARRLRHSAECRRDDNFGDRL